MSTGGEHSYYELLGVSLNATAEEIKAAFRDLAHAWHPDKVQAAEAVKRSVEERFAAIRAAYEVLSDPVRRREYDAQLLELARNAERARLEQLIDTIRAHLAQAQWQSALSIARRIYDQNPEDAERADILATVALRIAGARAEAGESDDARELLRLAMRVASNADLRQRAAGDLDILRRRQQSSDSNDAADEGGGRAAQYQPRTNPASAQQGSASAAQTSRGIPTTFRQRRHGRIRPSRSWSSDEILSFIGVSLGTAYGAAVALCAAVLLWKMLSTGKFDPTVFVSLWSPTDIKLVNFFSNLIWLAIVIPAYIVVFAALLFLAAVALILLVVVGGAQLIWTALT